MKKILLTIALMLSLTACGSGCIGDCEDYRFTLDSDYMARRQQTTRNFYTNNETEMLSASAAVLQDLGFKLEESSSKLGLLTATKERKISKGKQIPGMIADSIMNAALYSLTKGILGDEEYEAVYDVQQDIFATLVISKTSNGTNVRVNFARMVWNNKGEGRIEKIWDDAVYREFFEKLSKSVFLNAHNI